MFRNWLTALHHHPEVPLVEKMHYYSGLEILDVMVTHYDRSLGNMCLKTFQ